jgi:hypothetical protein
MLKTTLVAFLLAPSLFITQTNIDQEVIQEPVVVKTERQLILESISTNAAQYKINRDESYSLLMCESGLNPRAKGDSKDGVYLATNIAQYHRGTFNRHNEAFFKEYGYYLSADSWEDNIKLQSFALSKGWGNEWTMYRALKNGGTYSFYSKLLKKDFTVTCNLQKFPL